MGRGGDSSTETRCGLDMDGFLPLKGVVKDPSERGRLDFVAFKVEDSN